MTRRMLWWMCSFLGGYAAVLLMAISHWWIIPIALASGTAVSAFHILVLRHARRVSTVFRPGSNPLGNAGGKDVSDAYRIIIHTESHGGKAATRWRRHDGFHWLEIQDGRDPEEIWRQARFNCPAFFPAAPLGGAVIITDAASLLVGRQTSLPGGALDVLTRLAAAAPSPVPFHILVSGIDRLYGMASLMNRLHAARRNAPLGTFCGTPGSLAGAMVRKILSSLADQLLSFSLAGGEDALPPPCLQVPDEVMRLAVPLEKLCEEVFHNRLAGKAQFSGLFLFAAGPGGGSVTPRLGSLSGFTMVKETPGPQRPWFADRLLAQLAGAEGGAPGMGLRRRRSALFRRLLPVAASLAFCAMLFGSFHESQAIILSASPMASTSSGGEELDSLHTIAVHVRERSDRTRMPRFGLDHPARMAAALESKFAEAFHRQRTIPGLERLQNEALQAARIGDAQAIGESLLRLALFRERLSRLLAEGKGYGSGSADRMLQSLHLAGPTDFHQLDAYLRWTGPQEWMPAVHQTLGDFQTYLMGQGNGGAMAWLPHWIDNLPFLEAVETDAMRGGLRESVPSSPSRIAPAWTAEGYRFAKAFLESLPPQGCETAWSEARRDFLTAYRENALGRWLDAADALWQGMEDADHVDILSLMDRTATGMDPASAFTTLALRHLVPVFDGEKPPPAIRWLLLHAGARNSTGEAGDIPGDPLHSAWKSLAASVSQIRDLCKNPDDNLAVIRSAYRDDALATAGGRTDPYSRARGHAARVDSCLREESGGFSWEAVSATTRVEFLRRLGIRLAARTLDSAWRNEVYLPSRLVPGDETDRAIALAGRNGILHRFLGNAAAGLWTWERGIMGKAVWEGVEFPFASEFLHWSGGFLTHGFAEPQATMAMPFRIYSVSVDPDARERPVEVEFLLGTGEEEQRVAFRNVELPAHFTMTRKAPDAARIRLHFPASSVTFALEDPGAFNEFLALFQDGGECTFPPEDFDDPEALHRRGISRVTIRASLENAEALRAFVHGRPLVPPSIIHHENRHSANPPRPMPLEQAEARKREEKLSSPAPRDG